jgi:hypothetical protein
VHVAKVSLDHAEVIPGIWRGSIELDRMRAAGVRSVELTAEALKLAEVAVGDGPVPPQCDGMPKGDQGFVETSL